MKNSIKNVLPIIIGVIIILSAFKISVTTGFALVLGLCIGALLKTRK